MVTDGEYPTAMTAAHDWAMLDPMGRVSRGQRLADAPDAELARALAVIL